MTRYNLVKAANASVQGSIVCTKPKCENFNADDWQGLRSELHNLRPSASWSRGIFDLENPERIWLVDSEGRMSHYLEARSLRGGCQTCGHTGVFVRMALCCPAHGAFAGI